MQPLLLTFITKQALNQIFCKLFRRFREFSVTLRSVLLRMQLYSNERLNFIAEAIKNRNGKL